MEQKIKEKGKNFFCKRGNSTGFDGWTLSDTIQLITSIECHSGILENPPNSFNITDNFQCSKS